MQHTDGNDSKFLVEGLGDKALTATEILELQKKRKVTPSTQAGRRNVVGTIRVWMDDDEQRPITTAPGTYMLP